jgi:hypothetical protein
MSAAGPNVAAFPRQQTALEPFDTFSFSDPYEVRPVEWIVEGWIPRRCAVLFTGPTKLGKTYLLEHLFLCAALGKPWHGLDVAQVKSFGFFCEDELNWLMHRRDMTLAMLGESETKLDDEARGAARRGRNNWLMRFDRNSEQGIETPLWQQLVTYVTGDGYGSDGCRPLVLLDTARQVFDGNENAAQQVTQFMNRANWLAEQIDGAVIITHHPPKAGDSEFAGSVAWAATARAHIHLGLPSYFDRETGEGRGERVLRMVAGNYAGEPPDIALKWNEEARIFLPNTDLVARAAGPHTSLTTSERADLDSRVLIAAHTTVADGGWIIADIADRRSLAARLRKTSAFAKTALPQLQAAVDRLVEGHRLVRVTIGSGHAATVLLRPGEMSYPQERA